MFFGRGEQVLQMPGKSNEGTSKSREKPQEELAPTPRAWRLYIGRGPNKEGSRVGMIPVDPMEKEYSHAIRLNFQALEGDMDYEALLASLVASGERGMKDLHVFVDSRILVSINWARIPEPRSVGRFQDKTIGETQDKLPEETSNAPKKAASGKSRPTWEDRSGSY
ncbi:hypothetical protein Tco_0301071 [Tanacetum coccineum]